MPPHKEPLSRLQDDEMYSFSRSLRNQESSYTRDKPMNFSENEKRDEYELSACAYGKNNVKLLYVNRNKEPYHDVREYEIDTHLRLYGRREYFGDNRDIVSTDSQKNTVYVLAKKHGVQSPETFALLLCSHFLYTYKHVEQVSINIEEYPWTRYYANNQPHNHAFVMKPTATRFCQVSQVRNGPPQIRGGIKGLRVLKTTQSSFSNFIQDEYGTLQDTHDRIFSTTVMATWDYSTAEVDFDDAWRTVKECILENFAGPPNTGIHSPSVQNTVYLTEKCILDRVKQISSVEMQMPNKHYFDLDFSPYTKLHSVQGENKEVYLPVDKPSGIIYGRLNRKDSSAKL
ncbi:PREDICTED: uricase [Cyphomyrmex costatus]|uniref:Uricase n=1 Tax=Cyphomyrmex costatus TaxID=456900 RepID=A0A151ICF2_9HYME|nr:PREDICTED: uricase [Cyphomyrmex costatus]KYM97773.1 Uricase [Cyphomyrmex costatus]